MLETELKKNKEKLVELTQRILTSAVKMGLYKKGLSRKDIFFLGWSAGELARQSGITRDEYEKKL